MKVFVVERYFSRGIPASDRLRQCAVNVRTKFEHCLRAPIPPYKILGTSVENMTITRNVVEPSKFNMDAEPPYELRMEDFQMAMQDVYDFFYDVNLYLTGKGLQRLDDMLRPAIMSGLLFGRIF